MPSEVLPGTLVVRRRYRGTFGRVVPGRRGGTVTASEGSKSFAEAGAGVPPAPSSTRILFATEGAAL